MELRLLIWPDGRLEARLRVRHCGCGSESSACAQTEVESAVGEDLEDCTVSTHVEAGRMEYKYSSMRSSACLSGQASLVQQKGGWANQSLEIDKHDLAQHRRDCPEQVGDGGRFGTMRMRDHAAATGGHRPHVLLRCEERPAAAAPLPVCPTGAELGARGQRMLAHVSFQDQVQVQKRERKGFARLEMERDGAQSQGQIALSVTTVAAEVRSWASCWAPR